MIIEDGYGSGVKVKVDSDQRLWVRSSNPMAYNSLNRRRAYDFSTGDFVSITSVDTETGVFYLKNDEQTRNFFVDTMRTCADAVHKVKLYKNPTGGTLITNQTTGNSTNLNFNSTNTATATYYYGAEGSTISGGSVMSQHINGVGHSSVNYHDTFILGPGDSIGISFYLASAGDCCVRILGYFD